MSVSVISPKQLQDRVQAGVKIDLIDVRTPVEFQKIDVSFVPVAYLAVQMTSQPPVGNSREIVVPAAARPAIIGSARNEVRVASIVMA